MFGSEIGAIGRVIRLPPNTSFFFCRSGVMCFWSYEYRGDGTIGVVIHSDESPTPADQDEHREMVACVLAWRQPGSKVRVVKNDET
jgi:hypothetical protein